MSFAARLKRNHRRDANMVTHIPSPQYSTASLPLSPRSASSSSQSIAPPPPYAASTASIATAANQHHSSRSRPAPPPATSSSSRQHRAASSASSGYSHSTNFSAHTLVPPSLSTVITTPSVASASYHPPPPSYQQPRGRSGASVASTSAARPQPRRRSSRASNNGRERGAEASQELQNAFPWFGVSGDVEVSIKDRRGRKERRYLLHRLYLAQNSGFWEEELGGEQDAAGGSLRGSLISGGVPGLRAPSQERASRGERRIWQYELDWANPGSVDCQPATPILVRAEAASRTFTESPPRPSTSRNKPPPPSSSFFRRSSNSSAVNLSSRPTSSSSSQPVSDDDDLLLAYDNLFRIFYNHAPRFDAENIADAYVESKTLLTLAATYDALEVVGPRIDHHLLRFGSRLWKNIAKYPPSYLKLGHMARSRAIFAEALTHVVGQWPLGQPQLQRGLVDDAVVDLIEDKADELEENRVRVEVRLLRLTLSTSRGERVNPTNAYMDWLAVSLFRQWVAENTTPAPVGILKSPQGAVGNAQPPPVLRPSYGRVFRLLTTGGEAYLPHDELKRFMKSVPGGLYSRDALKKFERRMDELKNLARDAVRPMTRNFLELDLASGGVSHLTCTRCEERDFERVWEE